MPQRIFLWNKKEKTRGEKKPYDSDDALIVDRLRYSSFLSFELAGVVVYAGAFFEASDDDMTPRENTTIKAGVHATDY